MLSRPPALRAIGLVAMLMIIVGSVMTCTSLVFGQEGVVEGVTDAVEAVDNAAQETVSAYPQLATISGIIAATMIVVEVVKRLVHDVKILKDTPTWVYAIGVSTCLCLISRYALHAIDMEIGPLLWTAAIAAASGGGFFTWLRKPTDSPKSSVASTTGDAKTTTASFLILGLTAGMMSGCVGFSESQRYKVVSESYSSTMEQLTVMSQAGQLDLETMEELDIYSDRVNSLLDKIEDAIITNNRIDFEFTISKVQALINELLRMQLEAKHQSSDATSERTIDHAGSIDGVVGYLGGRTGGVRDREGGESGGPRAYCRRDDPDQGASCQGGGWLEGGVAAAA